MHLQHGAANKASPFIRAKVFISHHEEEDDGVDEVCKGEVECPEDSGAAGAGAKLLETGLGLGDFTR